MQAPWYLYIVGLVVALPVFFLWGVGAYGVFRAVAAWLTMPEAPRKQ